MSDTSFWLSGVLWVFAILVFAFSVFAFGVDILRNFFLWWVKDRKPDRIIYNQDGTVYMIRYHFIRIKWLFSIYIHNFCSSDDDRALHTHPWLWNLSLLLLGAYMEWVPDGRTKPSELQSVPRYRCEGDIVLRGRNSAHRIELFLNVDGKPDEVWSLFIMGPVVQSWGFWCKRGLVDYKIFTKPISSGRYSIGCGEE